MGEYEKNFSFSTLNSQLYPIFVPRNYFNKEVGYEKEIGVSDGCRNVGGEWF